MPDLCVGKCAVTMTKRSLTAPPPPPRTFDEAFAEHRLTPFERAALVWHLAAIRTRKLVETLLPETPCNQVWKDFAAGVLRSENIPDGEEQRKSEAK